jgi:probable HAF family extracellular repeat protein
MNFVYFNCRTLLRFGLIIVLFANLCLGKTPTFWGGNSVSAFLNYPMCVSSDGSVVGGVSFSSEPMAGVWQNGFIKYLGNGNAFGISADGKVVVGDSGSVAFRYKNGVMTLLGVLPGGSFSVAHDVSSDGNVIVGYSSSSSGLQAFRWENNFMTGLGYLPGFTMESCGNAVSGDGTIVVGYSKSAGGEMRAFRWENGVMTDLGGLPGGGHNVVANAISADGSVIVGKSDSNSGYQAFRWKDGVMVGLGISPGGSSSEAYGVSYDGSIVVGDCYNGTHQAFIWDEKHGMRNLAYVLAMDYGVSIGAGNLEMATAISDDGTTIVGTGNNSHGDYGGWLAVINPSSSKMAEDLNNDCTVNFKDFAILASSWLKSDN